MTNVSVDRAQAEAMLKTGELVEVRDESGTAIGFFAPLGLDPAPDYAVAASHFYPDRDKPRPDGPWYTSEQVAEYLKSLERGQ